MINNYNDENKKIDNILKGFKPPFYYQSFKEFYTKCGFTLDEVSALVEKSKKTVIRWEKTDAPRWCYLILYTATGFLLSMPFYGFRIKNNELFTSTRITYNYGFKANEIIEYSFFRDYCKNLEKQNRYLREKQGSQKKIDILYKAKKQE
jgi:DNA-binding XRE family transcriptional regulator